MAKLTAVRGIKKDGKTVIAGYKVALPKIELEKCGFKERRRVKNYYRKGGNSHCS